MKFFKPIGLIPLLIGASSIGALTSVGQHPVPTTHQQPVADASTGSGKITHTYKGPSFNDRYHYGDWVPNWDKTGFKNEVRHFKITFDVINETDFYFSSEFDMSYSQPDSYGQGH